VSPDRDGANRAFDEAIAKFEEALSRIDGALAAQPSGEDAAHLKALEALADASPMMKRQNAFNAAVVNEIRHQRSMQRAVLELVRCQSALVAFLRTVKPYVDTRDFADILRAISDDDLKRSDALLARDRRRELQLADIENELKGIRARLDELRRTVAS
jgi:uncharacterized protein YjiS (DUF1127 family)